MVQHWRRMLLALGASALSACSASSPGSQAQGAEAEANTPAAQTPEYAQKDGDTYMYVGAVSEEEKKQGKVAPVVAFRNLGLNGEAQRLEMLGDNGVGIGTVECSAPCRVAKQSDLYGNVTRVAVEPTTILAAAFRDAANGFLVVSSNRNTGKSEQASLSSDADLKPTQLSDMQGGFREPDFAGRDRDYSAYRTRIVNGLREEGANFARNYTIIRVGCGTGCSFNFIVNRKTGQVSSVPFGGEEQQMLDLRHSVNSNLLNASWFDGGQCMLQQMRWNGTRFVSNGDPTASPDSSCS